MAEVFVEGKTLEVGSETTWTDARKFYPPIVNRAHGTSEYYLCSGKKKGSMFIAKYMWYCDAWFIGSMPRNVCWYRKLPEWPADMYPHIRNAGKEKRTYKDRCTPRPRRIPKGQEVPKINEMWDRLAVKGVITDRSEQEQTDKTE